MYYPPLFTSVRPFDPRPNPLGGQLDVPVVGAGRENPLDLSVKTIRQTPDSTAEAEDLLMLDHRKLASLAASHSLSAMGRQLNPASALLDPALFRLTYGAAAAEAAAANSCSHAAMIPGLTAAPFCYDRATGVAVPTSLAGHQLMNSFLQQQQQQQQQQRERCLEQQHQALLAARTTAQQAALAAAFMDPASLPLHLRSGLSQRDAAVALAATRGLYAPTLPTPMVLPAFSLYTDDKGAFTSLRNSSSDKSYLNGAATNALEAARFAEHLQRLREQHLQQAAGKCGNTCCSSSPLSGLGQPTVSCACCIQSPSQQGLCARSAIGACVKDTSADTKVCNTNCDYMQSGLTYLHRPTAATAAPTDLRLTAPGYTTSETNSIQREDQKPLFQPSSVWTSGVPSVPAGKTAFSVPKKKEGKDSNHKENSTKCVPPPVSKENSSSQHNDKDRVTPQDCKPKFTVKTECPKREDKEVIVISEECPQRRMIPEKYSPPKPSLPKTNHHSYYINSTGAITTVTTATPTVPTKCEGGTIPITKMPPVLEVAKSSEPSYTTERLHDVQNSAHSPQGPPPLIAAPGGASIGYAASNNKTYPAILDPTLRLPLPVTPYTNPVKDFIEKTPCVEPSKPPPTVKSPKKELTASQGNVLPKNCIKEEPKRHAGSSTSTHSLPKPIPHVPSSTHHLPSAHYSSHYHPPSHLMHLTQQRPVWTALPSPALMTPPQITPPATTAPPPPPPPTSTSQNVQQQQQHQEIPAPTTIKKEPECSENNNNNVLQSLLVRPGSETCSSSLPSSVPIVAPGAFTPVAGPFASVDYHQIHRHVGIQRQVDNVSTVSAPIEKREPETNQGFDASTKLCSKKKPTTDSIESSPKSNGCSSEKKRMICEEYPQNNYVFPRASYSHSTGHYINSPLSPYTFIPENNSFNSQVPDDKTEEKPLNLNCSSAHKASLPPPVQPDSNTCYIGLPNIPNVWNDVKTEQQPQYQQPQYQQHQQQQQYQQQQYHPQPQQYLQQPQQQYQAQLQHYQEQQQCPQQPQQQQQEDEVDRMAKSRAKRRLRRKLLTRLHRKKKGLVPSGVDGEKAIALRHTRRLLSQLKLHSRHRRMLYKIHITRRKKLRSQLAQRRLLKNKKTVVYRIRTGALTKRIKKTNTDVKNSSVPKTQSVQVQPSPLTVPLEMKKLMVNKALGETILHKAARLGYPEVVVYCLETACCNVNARDNAGYTPLHECCSRGHLDIARALLQYGADVNASAAGGIRPLHDAIENDHVEIVRLLLSYGADPSIATYSGLVPLKLARSPLMGEFLQGFLADISGEMSNRPHLPWRFWGSASCMDPDDNGYDIFSGAPSDPEENGEGEDDFLFEVSDSPHLPTFRLPLPAASSKVQCNYLRLCDVLRKISLSKEQFMNQHSHIEVYTIPRHEFEASATCSQLLTGSKLDNLFPASARIMTSDRLFDVALHQHQTIDVVRLDNNIRKVLGIETISVR